MAITNTNQAKKVSTNGTSTSSSGLSSINQNSAGALETTAKLPSLNSTTSNTGTTTGTTGRKKYSGYDGNYGYVDYARDSGFDISSVSDVYEQREKPSYGFSDYARDMGYGTYNYDSENSNSAYENLQNIQFGSNANGTYSGLGGNGITSGTGITSGKKYKNIYENKKNPYNSGLSTGTGSAYDGSYGYGDYFKDDPNFNMAEYNSIQPVPRELSYQANMPELFGNSSNSQAQTQNGSYGANFGSSSNYGAQNASYNTTNNSNGMTFRDYIKNHMGDGTENNELLRQYDAVETDPPRPGEMTYGQYIKNYMNGGDGSYDTIYPNASANSAVMTPEKQRIQNNMNSQGIMTYDQFMQATNNGTNLNAVNGANASNTANTGMAVTGSNSVGGLTSSNATNTATTDTTASDTATADITGATDDGTATDTATDTTTETTDEETDSTSTTGTTYSDSQASLKTQYDETVKDAYNSYLKSLSDYGANAEKLNSMGLSNSGYSDYLNSQAYQQYRQDVADANNTYQSGLLSLEQSANESYQTFLDNITNGTTYTDSQIETYAKTYGWTDEQISSLKSSVNENTYNELNKTLTEELNSDGVSDYTLSEIQTSDLSDEQKQSLYYEISSSAIDGLMSKTYSASDYSEVYNDLLDANANGQLSDAQFDELMEKLTEYKETASILSKYGADVSAGISADGAIESSFGSYHGSNSDSEQSKYVNAVIQGAKDGKIPDGTLIDFNYGYASSNSGSIYVYYDGYFYETTLSRSTSNTVYGATGYGIFDSKSYQGENDIRKALGITW